MGFSSSGQISLRTNNGLRRSNRRLFLDKENKYPADSKDGLVNEAFREALEKENELYIKNRHSSARFDSLLKRVSIVFILVILLFGAYQLFVLFTI